MWVVPAAGWGRLVVGLLSPLNPYVSLLALSTLVTLGLAGYALRRGDEPGVRWFGALMAVYVVYAGSYAVALLVSDPGLRLLLERLRFVLVVVAPAPWLLFLLAYTGRDRLVAPGTVAALSVVPGVVAVAVTVAPGSVWSAAFGTTPPPVRVVDGVAVVLFRFEPLSRLALVYVYVCSLVGFGVIVDLLASEDPLYTDQGVSLLFGALVPAFAGIPTLVGTTPLPQLDLVPMSLWLAGLAYGNAVFRYRLFDRLPAARRIGDRAAVEDLDEPVVVLDGEDRVTNTNPAARSLFGPDLTGRDLDDLVGTDLPDEPAVTATVELTTERGRRTFEVTSSTVRDRHGRSVGRTLVFRDVTGRRRRERRVEVLNRVLRHNLRNNVTAVAGYADVLADDLDGRHAEMATTVSELATDLDGVAEKVRAFEEAAAGDPVPAAVGEVLRGVVDGVRRPDGHRGRLLAALDAGDDTRPDGGPTTSETETGGPTEGTRASADLELHVTPAVADRAVRDSALLRVAVANLLENAVEHGGTAGDPPRVVVRASAERTGATTWAVVTVADDGPGVPDHEREPVLDGETPLDHSSGLGLWVVRWAVDSLGGDLSIGDDDALGGASVTLRVPCLDPGGETGGVAPAEDDGSERGD
jgi:signal transduction histidine kinase